jgi:sirohydrochlorin cobaltochelatase
MCKYRTQVLGFEAEVGAVQESHHHHVEGISAKACELCDREGNCTGKCQKAEDDGPFKLESRPHTHHEHGPDHHHDHEHHHHNHTHAPYPHAAHPLGPKSMKRK